MIWHFFIFGYDKCRTSWDEKVLVMDSIEVDIHISSEEVLRAYQGAEFVSAYAVDGRSIRFPVKVLWSFITHEGIHGDRKSVV